MNDVLANSEAVNANLKDQLTVANGRVELLEEDYDALTKQVRILLD